MKKKILLSFPVLGVFLSLTLGKGAEPAMDRARNPVPTNMIPLASYHFAGRDYFCFVTESNFFGGPLWQPDKGEPPLSARRAVEIAQQHAKALVPKSDSFKPQEIALKTFIDMWFYVVQLAPSNWRAPGTGRPMGPIKIVVLMDGTVAEAVEQTNE
jgi:hypothetical protein